jgi:hypothetical protein
VSAGRTGAGYIGSGGEPPDLELAKIAVHILTSYLPADRDRGRRAYADLLEREFRVSGMEPPAWIARLRDEPWEGGGDEE